MHCTKIGEPNYPVAAAERGRMVLEVKKNESLGWDHDFTKFQSYPFRQPDSCYT